MDISYSLAIEDHGRINPLQGLEELAAKIVPEGSQRERVPAPSDVRKQNEDSMAMLKAMMAGTSNNPLRKGK